MLITHGPDSFEIRGALAYDAATGITIDGLDIVELIGQRLFGNDREGAKEDVGMLLEVNGD